MKYFLAIIQLLLLVSCTTSSSVMVSSQRSLDLTPQRVAKGGRIAILTESKLNHLYPSEAEKRQTQIIAEQLKKKGFSIVELPPDADYGFLYFYTIPRHSDAGYSMSGDSIYTSTLYVHQVDGRLYDLKPDGSPDKLLWSGTALLAAYRPSLDEFEWRLFEKMLTRFPD